MTTAPTTQTSSTYFGATAPLPFPLGLATAYSDVTVALVQFSTRTRSRHCVRDRCCRHRVNIRSFTALCKPTTNIPSKAFVIKTTLVEYTQKYNVLPPNSRTWAERHLVIKSNRFHYTDMRRLTMGLRSGKCVVVRPCTYTNLDSIA
jgi:hypothetical protein